MTSNEIAYHVFHDWASIHQKKLAIEVLGIEDKLNAIYRKPKYKSINEVKEHMDQIKKLLLTYDSLPAAQYLPTIMEHDIARIINFWCFGAIDNGCSCRELLLRFEFAIVGHELLDFAIRHMGRRFF